MHFAYVPEHKRTSLNPWVHLPVKSLPDVVQDVWGLKEEGGGGGWGLYGALFLGLFISYRISKRLLPLLRL